MVRLFPPVFRVLVAPLALGLLLLVFAGHLVWLSPSHALPGGDFREIHYPLLKFVSDATAQTGALPLWNPHQFLGYSVVGNPQYGLFYPPNLGLLLLRDTQIYHGISLVVALHVFWIGLGMACMARLFGALPRPALLAGALVAFGGTFVVRVYAGHYALLLTLSWAPWVLAAYRLSVHKGALRWALPGGFALALAILAGHPQTLYIIGLGLAVQWLFEILTASSRHNWWPPTRQLLLMVFVAAILGAVAWLPMVDYLPKTSRGAEQSLAFANEHAVRANALGTWLIPGLFGTPQTSSPGYFLDQPLYEEMFGYMGLLPLLLLLVAPLERRTYYFGALVLLGVVLSLGIDGGLYRAQYVLSPLARGFRAPGRALILTSIGLAGLAALALTRLLQMDRDSRQHCLAPMLRRVFPIGLVALTAATVLSTLTSSLVTSPAQVRAEFLAEQLGLATVFWTLSGIALWSWTQDKHPKGQAAFALTFCIIVLDLWHATWPLVDTDKVALSPIWQAAQERVPRGPAAQYGRVMQTIPPKGITNGASWTGHDASQGYDPLVPELWWQLIQYADWNPNTTISRLMSVRYILTDTDFRAAATPGTERFIELPSDGPFRFYENPEALPRTYMAGRYEVEPDPQLTLVRLALGHADGGELVLLTHDPGCPVSAGDSDVQIERYQPNSVTIRVSATNPGMLVLLDQYDDDWEVTVDGARSSLLRANYAFRGVCVPAGNHSVRFDYRPQAYYWGRTISLVGLSVVVLWLVWTAFGASRLSYRRDRGG